jgi:transcriptional regulator with XRE-family HTH domain
MPAPQPEESSRAFFAHHLKRLREQANLSQPALGAKVHVSGSLISGIETCNRTPGFSLCQALDRVIAVPHFFEALYPRIIEETGLPAGFPEYTDAEAEASVIRQYHNYVITGLFQTEEYARAVLRAGQHPEKLERLVAARMERQEVLHGDSPPVITSLVDATAVRRWFGDREIMHKQLEHLIQLADEHNIHIHVIPDHAQICPAGSFTLLSSPGEPDLGYAESAGGRGRLIDSSEYVAELGILWELIRSQALPAEDSKSFIRTVMENL